MPLKLQQLETPALNLTPMIDVVFNLMIFFMVGTQFVEMERQIEINVPQVDHVQPVSPAPNRKIVHMTADGSYMLGTQPVTLPQLTQLLSEARQADRNVQAVVRGNQTCSLQSLGEVLDAINAAGIYDIDMAVQPR
jgi:biopolymer transport protein ExbD